MCHPQFFQMVNAGCQLVGTYRSLFCQCQELSFMLNARRRFDGHITMVHFIKNHIGRKMCIRDRVYTAQQEMSQTSALLPIGQTTVPGKTLTASSPSVYA